MGKKKNLRYKFKIKDIYMRKKKHCADGVPAKCPHQQKARVDAGPSIRAQQGVAGADGVRDRCP